MFGVGEKRLPQVPTWIILETECTARITPIYKFTKGGEKGERIQIAWIVKQPFKSNVCSAASSAIEWSIIFLVTIWQ